MTIIISHTPAYANSILWVSARAQTALIKDEEFMVEAADAELLILTAPGVDDDEEPSPPAEVIDGLEVFFEEADALTHSGEEDEQELTTADETEPEPEQASAEDEKTDSIDIKEEEKDDEIQEP